MIVQLAEKVVKNILCATFMLRVRQNKRRFVFEWSTVCTYITLVLHAMAVWDDLFHVLHVVRREQVSSFWNTPDFFKIWSKFHTKDAAKLPTSWERNLFFLILLMTSCNTIYYKTDAKNCYYRRHTERYGLAAKLYSLFCR